MAYLRVGSSGMCVKGKVEAYLGQLNLKQRNGFATRTASQVLLLKTIVMLIIIISSSSSSSNNESSTGISC